MGTIGVATKQTYIAKQKPCPGGRVAARRQNSPLDIGGEFLITYRDMKVYVIGSSKFTHRMVEVKQQLCVLGHDAGIGEDYERIVRGELDDHSRHNAGETADIKRERDYLRYHYKRIMEHDAVIVVNDTKGGIKNYIGANVLIEMAQAYVHDKLIYLLNDMPAKDDLPMYIDEIQAMDPIALGGDLRRIPV